MNSKPEGFYKHFKGGLYEILYIAIDAETLEDVVVYESLRDSKIYTRTLEMFNEYVNVDGKLIPRFSSITYQN